MECPRLDHSLYILPQDPYGFTPCCALTHQPKERTLDDLSRNEFYLGIKAALARNEWPPECIRCQGNESTTGKSMRTEYVSTFAKMSAFNPDYLSVTIAEGSRCNAACQICNSESSSLYAKIFDEPCHEFSALPILRTLDPSRVLQLSFSGGEPSITESVIEFISGEIDNYPLQTLLFTSNGTRVIPGLRRALSMVPTVVVTLSADGVGSVYEYSRWPMKWDNFDSTVREYVALRSEFPNLNIQLLPAFSALNVFMFDEVEKYANGLGIGVRVSSVQNPGILSYRKNNWLTRWMKDRLIGSAMQKLVAVEGEDSSELLREFIMRNDIRRGISFNEYYERYGVRL